MCYAGLLLFSFLSIFLHHYFIPHLILSSFLSYYIKIVKIRSIKNSKQRLGLSFFLVGNSLRVFLVSHRLGINCGKGREIWNTSEFCSWCFCQTPIIISSFSIFIIQIYFWVFVVGDLVKGTLLVTWVGPNHGKQAQLQNTW